MRCHATILRHGRGLVPRLSGRARLPLVRHGRAFVPASQGTYVDVSARFLFCKAMIGVSNRALARTDVRAQSGQEKGPAMTSII